MFAKTNSIIEDATNHMNQLVTEHHKIHEEIEERHEQLKKDHEGYEYASDRDGISTHKD